VPGARPDPTFRVWRQSPETTRAGADATAFNDLYQVLGGKEPGHARKNYGHAPRPDPGTPSGWQQRVDHPGSVLNGLVENVGKIKPENRRNAAAMLRRYSDKLEASARFGNA
jgi:hypothetical protein